MEMLYTETFLLSLITYHLKRDGKRPLACISAIFVLDIFQNDPLSCFQGGDLT